MVRKIYKHCALCKREIYEGEDYVIESDRRGIVTRVYHKRCVQTRKATDRVKILEVKENTQEAPMIIA